MLYRWAFPICGIGGILFVFFAYFGTEERTVVHKQYVAKVKFTEGAKQLLTNKYFWIITIFSIAVGVRGNINMYLWICNYAIGGQNGAFVLTICNMLLNNALIPGMLLGPFDQKNGQTKCDDPFHNWLYDHGLYAAVYPPQPISHAGCDLFPKPV